MEEMNFDTDELWYDILHILHNVKRGVLEDEDPDAAKLLIAKLLKCKLNVGKEDE